MREGIHAEGLVKRYCVREKRAGVKGSLMGFVRRDSRMVTALDGVSMDIAPGELVGYVGPNGAGKSTSVKILAGILRPDGGTCEIDGRVPWRERVKHVARIGVVFGQKSQLLWDLPAVDSFDLMRDIYRVPQGDYEKTRTELVERMDAGSFIHTPVRQLSLGQRMRCEVIASLLHRPRLLFLDEPTIGLDATSKRALRAFVKERNEQDGLTVILTTHDMDDIEALCQRVMLIGKGKILLDGSPEKLKQGSKRRLNARVERPFAGVLPKGAEIKENRDGRVAIEFEPEKVRGDELVALLAHECSLQDVTIQAPRIEDVMAGVYERMAI